MSESGPDVSGMRIVYDKSELLESEISDNPLDQFNAWLIDSVLAGSEVITEPNAMVLATCSKDHEVTSRSVLLKGIDSQGLTFFTNYGSRKAQTIEQQSNVSVVFPWYPLHRQVVVIGSASKVSRDESEAYFRTRPHKSQLGAIVSAQSSFINSRDELENAMAKLEAKYPEGSEIPMPEFWGGYLIAVESMEFWQGRRSRLHDRLRFIKTGASSDLSDPSAWKVARVSP